MVFYRKVKHLPIKSGGVSSGMVEVTGVPGENLLPSVSKLPDISTLGCALVKFKPSGKEVLWSHALDHSATKATMEH